MIPNGADILKTATIEIIDSDRFDVSLTGVVRNLTSVACHYTPALKSGPFLLGTSGTGRPSLGWSGFVIRVIGP